MSAATPVILGAGPAGLSAALNLGPDAVLVEKEERVGGCCRSITVGGFTFDIAGHVMYSNDAYVHDLYSLLLGDNVHWREREAWIYRKGVHTRYPPGRPVSERGANGNGHANGNGNGHANGNGNGHANGHGAGHGSGAVGPNPRFGYPLKGGFQALMDGFLAHLRCDVRLETEAVRLSPSRRAVVLSDGSTLPYETVISTIPLPRLVRLMGPEAPPEVRDAAAGLRHLSVRRVNLGVGRPDLTDMYWIYYPEETVFHRVFAQGNASPYCNPPGGFGLTCEITYSPDHPLPVEGDELARRCVEDCRKVGLIGPGDPVWTCCQADLPYAYVVYDRERGEGVEHIRAWMLERDVLLAGRFGEWEYHNSDHAFAAGRDASIAARERSRQRRAAAQRSGRPQQPVEWTSMTL